MRELVDWRGRLRPGPSETFGWAISTLICAMCSVKDADPELCGSTVLWMSECPSMTHESADSLLGQCDSLHCPFTVSVSSLFCRGGLPLGLAFRRVTMSC